jgi:hypothetical protein
MAMNSAGRRIPSWNLLCRFDECIEEIGVIQRSTICNYTTVGTSNESVLLSSRYAYDVLSRDIAELVPLLTLPADFMKCYRKRIFNRVAKVIAELGHGGFSLFLYGVSSLLPEFLGRGHR